MAILKDFFRLGSAFSKFFDGALPESLKIWLHLIFIILLRPAFFTFTAVKKFLVIGLLMVYAASSWGMTLHFHYCCGKLKSVDLQPDKRCGMKGNHLMGSKPCCNDKKVEMKITGEQQAAKVLHPLPPTEAMTPAPGSAEVLRPVPASTLVPEVFAPPPLLPQPLFLLHRVFRI